MLLLLSRFFLPQRLIDNRSGVGILETVYQWGSNVPSVYEKADFPARFYHTFYSVFPFMPNSLRVWDAVALLVGLVLVMALFDRFNKRYEQGLVQTCLLFALAILGGIFIFQVSKDLIQCLIFTLAFALATAGSIDHRMRVVLLVTLFAAEGILWRTYYFIAALFVPILYWILTRGAAKSRTRGEAVRFILLAILFVIASMLAFAYVLHSVSPADYDQIVYQHSRDREDFTATDAASGIASVISLSVGSPPALFVINWAINVLRLLFPIELVTKSLGYLPFVVYQLAITWCLVRAALRNRDLGPSVLVIALLMAFVITSASFEPDFGSWIRHETAALPFLVELVGLSRIGTKERLR